MSCIEKRNESPWRNPYAVEIRPLAVPFYRPIGIAVKDRERLGPATRKFMEYLRFRPDGRI